LDFGAIVGINNCSTDATVEKNHFMLQRFIEWIDSLGEQMNPLVVRDVRRMFRDSSYLWFLCLYCVVITIIVVIGWNGERDLPVTSFAKASFAVACTICCIGAFMGYMAICDMMGTFSRDKLFLMNSLSPHQYLHAYITISIIKSSFIISLSLPLLTATQLIGIRGLDLHFLIYIIPILAFLLGLTLNLLFLSFMAHVPTPGIKCFLTVWEQIGEFFLGFLLSVGFCAILLPWFLVGYLWSEVFKLLEFSINNGFDLFSIYFLLPMALLTISATAYKLSRYGFRINYKPNVSGFVYNVLIYNVLSFCLAAIYFILVLLFR
jgi:hypothetical protein